jgi:hypothetical protein
MNKYTNPVKLNITSDKFEFFAHVHIILAVVPSIAWDF